MAPCTVEWRTKAHQRIEAHWFIFDSHGLQIWNLECSSVCFLPVTASWYWKQDWDRLKGKNVAEVHEFMRASEVLENSSTQKELKTTQKNITKPKKNHSNNHHPRWFLQFFRFQEPNDLEAVEFDLVEYPEDPKPHGRNHESNDESRRDELTTRRSERRREREARPKPREPREPGVLPGGFHEKSLTHLVGGWSLKGFF